MQSPEHETVTNKQSHTSVQELAILNQAQLSELLGLSPSSVSRFCERGLIPKIKLGRRTLFRREAVLEALKALEVGGAR